MGATGGSLMLAAMVLTTVALGCTHVTNPHMRTPAQRTRQCKRSCSHGHVRRCGRAGARDTAQHLTCTLERPAPVPAPASPVSTRSSDSGLCCSCEHRAGPRTPRAPLPDSASVSAPATSKHTQSRTLSRDFDIAFVSEALSGTSVLVDALEAVVPGFKVPVPETGDGVSLTRRPFHSFSVGRRKSRRCNLWDVKANDCALPDSFGESWLCAHTGARTSSHSEFTRLTLP